MSMPQQFAALPTGSPAPWTPAWTGRLLPPALARPSALTMSGLIMAGIILLLPLSAWRDYRIEIGKLKAHAYLFPLGLAFLAMALTRIGEFPRKTLAALLIFWAMFCYTTLLAPPTPVQGTLEEIVKLTSAGLTILTAALLIRSEKDFAVCSIAYVAGVTALAMYGLATKHDSFDGANPLELSNENQFSMFTMPAVMLCGYAALDRRTPVWLKWAGIAAILIMLVQTFSTAGRSGWLGMFVVGGLLLFSGRGNRLRATLAVVVVGTLGYFVVEQFSDLNLVSFRWNQTVTGQTADRLRVQLLLGGLQMGLDNPIVGVSPQMVAFEMPKYIDHQQLAYVDAHNVFGYVCGGSGLITFAALFYVGWSLFKKPPGLKERERAAARDKTSARIQPHRLLQLFVILWAIRANFTREMLYYPPFCLAMGLVIGLCIAQGVWAPQKRVGSAIATQPVGAA